MRIEQFFLSTIASDAVAAAKIYGIGLELADYAAAYCLDDTFDETDQLVRQKLEQVKAGVFHAPFNEVFPTAIDPKVVEIAALRIKQSAQIAIGYGVERIVVHSGFIPQLFFKEWYQEKAVTFWQKFLQDQPAEKQFFIENVLEEDPRMLCHVVEQINDKRVRLCLDVGHANAYGHGASVMEWLKECAPFIGHFHLHNNDGTRDAHQGLMEGTIPMEQFLKRAGGLCPEATYTLEVREGEPSLKWLFNQLR